jgi:AraC-like DNA-binding protein
MRVWSTEALPARERFSFWNDAVCDAFLRVRTERDERASFLGRISSAAAGPLAVNRVASERHLVRRSRRNLAADGDAWFFVNLQQGGRCVLRQDGRDQLVEAGDLCFFDSVRPFDLDFVADMALSCFMVPRAALTARVADAAGAVVQPLPSRGAGALLRSFAASLAANAAHLSPAEAAQAGTMFVDLLALTLGATAAAREAARPAARRALFDAACAAIRVRLGDPALDLAVAARLMRCAPRTLQALFQEHGATVSGLVLEERLRLADRQLAQGRATVTEIAYATGFSDLSYFSRAFRRRFGMSPRDRRRAADEMS